MRTAAKTFTRTNLQTFTQTAAKSTPNTFTRMINHTAKLLFHENDTANVLRLLSCRTRCGLLAVLAFHTPWRVPGPSYQFRRNFGKSGKGSFTEKDKIVDGRSVCSEPESTGCKLQYDPYLFSVACPQTELSISGKIWENR